MRPTRPSPRLTAALLCAAFFGSCDGDRSGILLALPVSVMVAPAHPSIADGTTAQLTAVVLYEDGSTREVTAAATWETPDPAIVDLQGGLARGLAVGVATVTAVDPVTGMRGTAIVDVTAAEVVSIEVAPASPSIALGTSQAFTAVATYTDGSTQDLTASVAWEATDGAVADVVDGLATGTDLGTTAVTATDPASGVSGAAVLEVTAAVLTSIIVDPTNPAIALGTQLAFTATGLFSDGTTQDLTASVTWSAVAAWVATIGNAPGSCGLATSVAVGSTDVTATDPGSGKSGATTLDVTAAVLVSIAVTPASPSIALGTQQAFTATGTYSDATTQDLTTSVTWTSSATSVATISNAPGTRGLATSVAVGSADVTATDPGSGTSGVTTLDVTAAVLASIAVTPASPSIALGTQQAFVATGTYSDVTTQDLTNSVTWTSSATSVATISNAPGTRGLATSVAIGSTDVTATDPGSGTSGATTLDVTAAVLVSIAVTPANPTIAPGTTQAFTATGTYSDASTQDITNSVTWSSSATSVATISNASGSHGLATSVAAGSTAVTATDAATSIRGTTDLTVFADIALRSASSGAAASGVLSLAIAKPAGTVADDVLVAAVCVRPSTATITAPAGWTLVRRTDNASGIANSLATYVRVAGASEPASYTWTLSSSTGSAGGIGAFSGVDTASPVEVESGQATASSLTHSAPSVTTTSARTMVVTAHAFSSSATWTPPAGMTEAFDVASMATPNAAGMSIEGDYALKLTAGATGVKSAVASNDSDGGNAHVLALERAP